MITNRARILRLAIVAFSYVFVFLIAISAREKIYAQVKLPDMPLATDWSHRHLVFSAPGSMGEALAFQQQPRYLQQVLRRNLQRQTQASADSFDFQSREWERISQGRAKDAMHRDWSQSLGGAAATVGEGRYPAKFSFSVSTASCASDFVVFNTGLAGASGQASIIAYNNIYAGCGGTVPTVAWAYNTGGAIPTDVSLSGDGSQVTFVQTQAGVATLVVLKWKTSATETAITPMTLSSTGASSYHGCSAPCMTTLTFSGSPADTTSSPFYDFTPGSDTLYAGDDTGKLHKFMGIFLGTPAEAGSPWPAAVATVKLSSPVFDPTTGNVFVTTSYTVANNSGARIDAVCANATCAGVSNGNSTVAIGTATPSLVLGPTQTTSVACHGTGASGNASGLILDSPIVDSTAKKVYVFVGNDGNGNSAVIQFPTVVSSTQFTFHGCGTESTIGSAATTGTPVYAGDFDNVYYTSASGSSPSGNLYVCGHTSGAATLYQVRVTANVMTATGTSILAISTGATTCSSVTESDVGATDLVFVSVQNLGVTTANVLCPTNTGCLMSFAVPTTLAGALPTHTTARIAASGGTSGIIIDNTVASGTLHTAQIYFSSLTGSTAVQASQAALN